MAKHPRLLHQLIEYAAASRPDATALQYRGQCFRYRELYQEIQRVARGMLDAGIAPGDRVGIFLGKTPEAVISYFAATLAGATMVPLNPLLKAAQAGHILRHSGTRLLITNRFRWAMLEDRELGIETLVLTDPPGGKRSPISWRDWGCTSGTAALPAMLETDLAALLYTSGSTGQPKGVMLSHENLLLGARSVCEYLGNVPEDRILALLPFSFDYGFSQLTTAFLVGARVILLDYLLPSDVLRACERHAVTGLAAIPDLWRQLARAQWPPSCRKTLRYLTSSGGTMPPDTSLRLQALFPDAEIHLMYGLTEAFRSTSLDPGLLVSHPDSIGKPIPRAILSVRDPQGNPCAPGQAGELVHVGPLVAQGYWQDPEATRKRFVTLPEYPDQPAVYSGDQVLCDDQGLFYFLGRKDEQIKVSGYRISPEEIESVIQAFPGVEQAIAFAVPAATGETRIQLLVMPSAEPLDIAGLERYARDHLPAYMLPQAIDVLKEFPTTVNGKPDRAALKRRYCKPQDTDS